MTVCRYYQQGNCRFGDGCRFDHPVRNQARSNRFGQANGGLMGASNLMLLEKYCITPDVIIRDLTIEKPPWILSAYAPGRDAPEQLFGGYPCEQSFEELRLHYMLAKAAGNEQQAIDEVQSLYRSAQEQIDNARHNAVDAANFVAEAENRHPNRHDICRQGTQATQFGVFLKGRKYQSAVNGSVKSNPFSTGKGTASSPFGQGASDAKTFAQPSNPFATPVFGQQSQPTPSAFDQPSNPFATSALGQPAPHTPALPTPAFGQTSSLGAKPSLFASLAFGKTAQANLMGNTFGQPSQLGHRPNPFASNPQATANERSAVPAHNPFAAQGSNQDSTQSSPFAAQGSNVNETRPNPFASNITSQSNASAHSFTQGAALESSPFGVAGHRQVQAESTAPIAQNTQLSMNGGFGKLNSDSFQQGAPSFGTSRLNTSGAPATHQVPVPVVSKSPYSSNSTRQHPPLESYSSKSMDGRLARFKGQTVTYKNNLPGIRASNGTWLRIWFPDGPPVYSKDTEMALEQYDDKVRLQWKAFGQTGRFSDGIMPSLPPPREFTLWDF